ncbi:hypothetical protein MMC30_008274 [Trapelia coarctata]|nr:hypothetical protein [Trapelia coarctata]
MSLESGVLTHPWTVLAGQIGLISLTVGFTRPDSHMRSAMLLPILLAALYYILVARYRVENTFQVNWGASQAVLALYQYIDVALANKWDFDFSGPQPREPTKKKKVPYGPDNFWNRIKFGFYAASSFRNSGTPFETRGLQPFSKKDPAYVPSTERYLITTGMHFVTCYLILDALTSLGDPEAQAALFAEHKIPLLSRLREVTVQEVIERTICSFAFWLVNYLVLSTSIMAVSLIMVSTGLSDVTWWKPLFNFGNGFPYTIRRFWSHFWHLSVKNRIFAPSVYLTDRVLKLPRGSLASRYTTLMLTFVLSVVFHGVGDIAGGISPSKTGAPQFFMAQAGAIVAEDIVQYLWKSWFPSASRDARWQKIVGQVWVFLFMFWCTPFYAYPVTAHNGDGLIVPFSIMRRVLKTSSPVPAVPVAL